jgi:DNA modification methylase
MYRARMKLERAKLDALTCDPANVRKHDQRNLDAIKGSLQRFGQQHPIIVDGDGIIRAGNGRYMAMRALGWSECDIVRTALKGAEATAFAIADNRTAELASWDDEALAQQLAALQIEDEELALATGYDEKEIAALALDSVEVQEDEIPEPPADPITKPGDLWLLGDHRLLCGDSTKADDVARLMDGEKASMVFTDPPYGIDYSDVQGRFEKIANDATDPTNLVAHAIAMQPADAVYLCCNWRCLHAMTEALKSSGLEPKATIVWDKGSRIQNLDRYGKRHEFIVYSGPYGGQATLDDDVWAISRETRNDHPTAKPVKLCGRAIQHASDSLAIIYDPFLGSGTTLIAAEQLGRKCYGMEISPAYCDVIVKRWEALTGKQAQRA